MDKIEIKNLIKELIENDAIGKVINIKADFCFLAPYDKENRFYNLDLGGGALLDVGGYVILFAIHLLGYPIEINAKTVIGETGVDMTYVGNLNIVEIDAIDEGVVGNQHIGQSMAKL